MGANPTQTARTKPPQIQVCRNCGARGHNTPTYSWASKSDQSSVRKVKAKAYAGPVAAPSHPIVGDDSDRVSENSLAKNEKEATKSSESNSNEPVLDAIQGLTDLVWEVIVIPEPLEPGVKYDVTQDDCVPKFCGPKPGPNRYCEREKRP